MKFRTRKKLACVANARPVPSRANPLRLDPSRTTTLRRAFVAQVNVMFGLLKGAVVRLVVDDDVFGLQRRNHALLSNTAWQFTSDPDRVREFQEWLKQQFGRYLLGRTEEDLWRAYVIAGFKKGQARAFEDWLSRNPQEANELLSATPDYIGGAKEQFLRDSFAQPVSVDKVKLLAGRTFDDLRNVTHDMSTRMTRTLADGLAQGKGPREIARDLNKAVDIGRERALLVATTELSRSHAEGQLVALQKLGVEELGVMVEWTTSGLGVTKAGYPSPCNLCAPLQGIVVKIDEASGMIPRHPRCKCVWLPSGALGESTKGQVRGAAAIRAAILKSKGKGSWASGKRISTRRPKSILTNLLINAFCPTGAGGGVDPTCSPHGPPSVARSEQRLRELVRKNWDDMPDLYAADFGTRAAEREREVHAALAELAAMHTPQELVALARAVAPAGKVRFPKQALPALENKILGPLAMLKRQVV